MEHIIYSCEILRSNCHRTRICDFEFGILESVAAAVGPMRAQAAQVTEPSNDLPPSPAGNRSDRARMPCRSTGQARPGTPESLSSRPGSRARERRSEAWNGEAGRRRLVAANPSSPLDWSGSVANHSRRIGGLPSLVLRCAEPELNICRSDRGVRMLLLSRGSTSVAATTPRLAGIYFFCFP